MSSLRLALKQSRLEQSLAESGQQFAAPKKKKKRRDSQSRERPKKRGPGRPRKDGTSYHSQPSSSSDNENGGSSSDENEFSGSSDNDDTKESMDSGNKKGEDEQDAGDPHQSDTEDSARIRKKMKKKKRAIKRHRDSAANRIQSQWKKKKVHHSHPTTKASVSTKDVKSSEEDDGDVDRRHKSSEKPKESSSKKSAGSGKAKTVPPPAANIISYVAGLSVESQRKHLAAGLRVKVRFEMKKKRDGKLIRRRKWYGGLVTGASKGGSKIRIKYDDGTTEVSKYPDEDTIIVDAAGNGRHRVPDDFFVPPILSDNDEQDDDDDKEPESPAPRYAVSPTKSKDSRGSSHADDRDAPKKPKKMTPTSAKSPSQKRRVVKAKQEEESKQQPAEPDTPIAPPPVPQIETHSKSPSPVFHGVPFSHSHDSSETSGTKSVRKRPDDSDETEDEDTDGKLSEDSLEQVEKRARNTEASHTPAPEKMEQQSLPKSSPNKTRKLAPAAEKIAPKKPTLTIRLKPPKGMLRKLSNASHAAVEKEDDEASENGDTSSEEEMSVDGLEKTRDTGTATGAIQPSRSAIGGDLDTEAGQGSAERRTSDSSKLANAVDQVSGASTPKEEAFAGFKRPLPSVDDDDDDEPPAKKKAYERSDTNSDASPTSETSAKKEGEAAAVENMPRTDSAGVVGQNATKATTKSKDSAPQEKLIPTGLVKLSASVNSAETKPAKPSEHAGEHDEKQGDKSFTSPLATEKARDNVPGSPEDAESPKALSVDPAQSSSKMKLSKPVSSVATPAVKMNVSDDDTKTKEDPILTGSKNSAFVRKASSVSTEESELKTMATSASRSDEESASRATTPLPLESKGSAVAVARSGRKAALQANQRIASRQELVIQDPFAKAKKKRGKLDMRGPESTGKRKYRRAERDDDDDGRHWVRCDNCQKWRMLPRTVETEKLPKHWYCEMNIYDSLRNNCDAPEQKAEEETKKKKRKRGRPRAQTPIERQGSREDGERPPSQEPTLLDVSSEKAKQRASSRSPSLEIGEKLLQEEVSRKGRRPSPVSSERRSPDTDTEMDRRAESSGKSTKKSKSLDTDDAMNIAVNDEKAVEVPAPKKRGRKKKDKSEKGKVGKGASKDEDDNQEWVQCEKCEKWRRLPPNISSEDLPEVWYCKMNTWDKASASCDVEEDKADPSVCEYNIFGTGQSSYGTSGKVSYRNLIFAKTGKRHNRLISERTRAAESLFASIPDENSEDILHHTVKYANSSAFVPRKSNATTIDDSRRVSLFELMHHSNLWAELRLGTNQGSSGLNNGNSHSHIQTQGALLDGLSAETKRSLKELVFGALGAGVLAGHEVLLEAQCRQWEADWEGLRAYCTIDVVNRMLLELVQDGVVEVIRENNAQISSMGNKAPRYRRVAASSSAAASSTSERTRTRCMKISKPWKNRQ